MNYDKKMLKFCTIQGKKIIIKSIITYSIKGLLLTLQIQLFYHICIFVQIMFVLLFKGCALGKQIICAWKIIFTLIIVENYLI